MNEVSCCVRIRSDHMHRRHEVVDHHHRATVNATIASLDNSSRVNLNVKCLHMEQAVLFSSMKREQMRLEKTLTYHTGCRTESNRSEINAVMRRRKE